MSFNESKVQRDEKGRFTGGGLGGFAAKHGGLLSESELRQLKLGKEPRSGLDKWAGKVSGRAREIEVPLIRKLGEAERVVSSGKLSGDLPANGTAAYEKQAVGSPGVRAAVGMIQKLYDKKREQIETLKAEGLKLSKAVDRAIDKRTNANSAVERTQEEIDHFKLRASALEKMRDGKTLTDAEEYVRKEYIKIGPIEAKFEGAQAHLEGHEVSKVEDFLQQSRNSLTKFEAQLPKDKKAAERADVSMKKKMKERREVLNKLGDAMSQHHALIAASNIVRAEHTFGLEGHTFEVSHSPHEGWVQLHIRGESKSEDHPGEKEMSVVVTPGHLAAMKVTKRGVEYNKDHPEHKDVGLEVTSQLPTDRKGKPHPDQVEISHPLSTTGTPELYTHEHIKKFLAA